MQTHIRRARPSDAETLARLAARTFADTFGADNTPDDVALHLATAYGATQQGAEIDDPEIDVLLAEVEGVLAGFAEVRSGETPGCVDGASPLELWRFYVDAPWHGRGVAHALMDEAERAAQQRGAFELWLSVWERNTRAQGFYSKRGFVQTGTKAFVVGTDVQTDWGMVKRLPRP